MKSQRKIFCALICTLSFGTASAEEIARHLDNATHKVYLGHCDGGAVQITAYKVAGDIRLEEYAMTQRMQNGFVPKLYTVEIPDTLRVGPEDPPSRFYIVNASGVEREYQGSTVYVDIKTTAPNLYNQLRNITGFGLDEKGNLEPNTPGTTYHNDCVLNNKDETGPWDPIPGKAEKVEEELFL